MLTINEYEWFIIAHEMALSKFWCMKDNSQKVKVKGTVADAAAGKGGAEKHEIYAATFGGHLFYDLFLQGRGGAMAPLAPPGSATEATHR